MAKHPDLTERLLALQFAQFVRQRQPTCRPLVRTGAPDSFLLSITAMPNATRGLYA